MYAQSVPDDKRLEVESAPSINASIHDKIVLTRVLCGYPHIKPQYFGSLVIPVKLISTINQVNKEYPPMLVILVLSGYYSLFQCMCLVVVKKPRDYTRFHEINTEILWKSV